MFWNRDIVDTHTAEWVEEAFAWLIETLGPDAFFVETSLVEPTRSFFDVPGGDSHETALAVFERIKELMGMTEWPCELLRSEANVDPLLAPTVSVEDVPLEAAGTFGFSDESVQITYDPGLMTQPLGFVSTMAHELCHYLLAEHVETAPGGEEAHEIMTDLAAIYAGFGILQIQGGMVAEGFQDSFAQGWQIGNLGYLSTEVRCYALAVFIAVRDMKPNTPEKYFDDGKTRLYRRALKLVAKRQESISMLKGLAGVSTQ